MRLAQISCKCESYIVFKMKRKLSTIIACYSLEGKLVRTYPSATAASKSRNVFKRTIDRSIRGDIKTVKNLQWKRYPIGQVPKEIEPVEINKSYLTIIPIAEVNELDEIIEVYPSIRNAAKKNNISMRSLRDRLNKKYTYRGKTKFRYLKDNEIAKYNLKKGTLVEKKAKAIIQYNLDGSYVKTYPSIRKATISMGRKETNKGIYQCLTGKYQTAFGYIWKYKKAV